jgi:hypothetical protein
MYPNRLDPHSMKIMFHKFWRLTKTTKSYCFRNHTSPIRGFIPETREIIPYTSIKKSTYQPNLLTYNPIIQPNSTNQL